MNKGIAAVVLMSCMGQPMGAGSGATSGPTGDKGTARAASRPVEAGRRVEAVSLLGRDLSGPPPGADLGKLEEALRRAEGVLRERPDDPESFVWVGRRLGYLWRMGEAIEVYSRGIEKFPKDAALYRHRGHRYISIRKFASAIADLEKAAELIDGQADVVEQDGQPNERGIPLTSLHFNVWYHLGVARYLSGDFGGAAAAFEGAMKCRGKYDDNLVAVTDWKYMAERRLGNDEAAKRLLKPIGREMEIIENRSYQRRLLMYQGLLKPEELLDLKSASETDVATMGYGVGNWYWCAGERDKARGIFERVVEGEIWPAFGFIAAEVELARNVEASKSRKGRERGR